MPKVRVVYAALLLSAAPVCNAGFTPEVPELDGTGALSAIALLAGVVAVAAELRRRKATRGRSR